MSKYIVKDVYKTRTKEERDKKIVEIIKRQINK